MSITAKYIGQSTVQISTIAAPVSGTAEYVSFATIANTIADAITGTQPGAAGTTISTTLANGFVATAGNSVREPASAVTFTNAAGVTAQANSGWTMIDAFWGSDFSYAIGGISDIYSPTFTQVFKSLCKDGVMYKICIIRYNLLEGLLNVSSCESWNVSTHQPTNEVHTLYDIAPIGFNRTNMDMIVMVSPRWICLTSFIGNEQGNWAGVFEVDREDPSDTGASGYPCWFWLSNYSLTAGTRGGNDNTTNPDTGSRWSARPGNNSYHQVGSFPRTRDGSTGYSALQKYWGFDLGFLSYPAFFNDPGYNWLYQISSQGAAKFQYSGWQPSKRITLPFKPILNITGTPVNYGQANGLKFVGSIGYSMNKITVPVDADGNASGSGTNRPHWLLNNTYKYPELSPYVYGPATTSFTTAAAQSTSLDGSTIVDIVTIGTCSYSITGGNRIWRTNLVSLAAVEISISGFTQNGALQNIAYDGERYLWICRYVTGGTNCLARIDTVDDSYVLYSVAAVGASNAPTFIGINGALLFLAVSQGSQTVGFCYALDTIATNGTWTNVTIALSGSVTNGWCNQIKVTPEGKFVMAHRSAAGTYVYGLTWMAANGGPISQSNLSNSTYTSYMCSGAIQIDKTYMMVVAEGASTAVGTWAAGVRIWNSKSMTDVGQLQSNTTTGINSISLPNALNVGSTSAPSGANKYRFDGAKYAGYLNAWNTGVGNSYMISIDLAMSSFKASIPSYMNVSSTTGSTGYMFTGDGQQICKFDGSRLILGDGQRIKTITNLIGNSTYSGGSHSGFSYGQLTLPA